MDIRLGIGVTARNQWHVLDATLAAIAAHTRRPHRLVVADDGSDDGTPDRLRARQVTVLAGARMGLAWNHNRALFRLIEVEGCHVALLLDADCYPTQDGWEEEWLQAALRWGHASLAGDWLKAGFIRGAGTLDDPLLSTRVSGKCAAYGRATVGFVGYRSAEGYQEHAHRMLRLGYGGTHLAVGGMVTPAFKLLRGGVARNRSMLDIDLTPRGRPLAIAPDPVPEGYRAPWRNDAELRQFRAEVSD